MGVKYVLNPGVLAIVNQVTLREGGISILISAEIVDWEGKPANVAGVLVAQSQQYLIVIPPFSINIKYIKLAIIIYAYSFQ